MFASSVATRSTQGPRPIAAVMAAIAAGAPAGDPLVGLASVAYADTTPADPSSPATPTNVTADAVPTTLGLTASFDGGGSSDPDRTVATWAGNFSDNTAGSGAASSHAHATAGIHFVSLTVTDKQGATTTVTNPETVVARVTPPGTLLALSQFPTQTTNSWGVAETGGRRTNDGSATAYNVANGEVQLQLPQGGKALQVLPVSETFINSTRMNVRVQVFGTIPTTIRASTWAVGTVEPTDWQAVVTDPTAALQIPGSVGLHSHLSSTATGQTVTSRFDDFTVSQL